MLRDPGLIPLSHQHQHALALCVRLDRALQAGEVDVMAWQVQLHQHYENEVQFHFVAEEKVLFPAALCFSELVPLVGELRREHEQLRTHFAHAEHGAMDRGELEALGKLLADHIRKEERQLFEAIQRLLPRAGLETLGAGLRMALEDAVQVCRRPPGPG